MQVIATAGHADHGKSALLRALTGMDPDRLAEDRLRGLAIDLGFAWLELPSGERIAFVDVPGHERFLPNMLAGVGQVPAVLFVVAADEGWMPQSVEHLAVIDALGVSRGLLAITRSDLADPGPALARAVAEIGQSSLGQVPAVMVSAATGAGLPDLVTELDKLAHSLPLADPSAPVRLWVDRAFTMAGSGTVVSGTLPAGTVHRGDELVVTPSMRPVRVREIQSFGERAESVSGVARVALNLSGISRDALVRGTAIVQAGRWMMTDVIDIRVFTTSFGGGQPDVAATVAGPAGAADGGGGTGPAASLPRLITLHVGSARSAARVRPLGSDLARLSLRDPLPLHVGDRVLVRDPGAGRPAPGSQSVPPVVLGAVVLDVAPPPLTRRGAAAAAARELATWPDQPSAADLLRRHGLLRASALLAMGIREHPEPVTGEWLADPGCWTMLGQRLGEAVAGYAMREPLAVGLPVEAARAALELPDRRLITVLARPPFRIKDGAVQVLPPVGPAAPAELPEPLQAAIRVLRADLAVEPFVAPDAERLRKLGLDGRGIAAAAKSGLLLRVSEQIVLAPGADVAAAEILARLPQPFTAAQARAALNTTRRIAIPLLEYLDRNGVTERLPDDRRMLRAVPDAPVGPGGGRSQPQAEQVAGEERPVAGVEPQAEQVAGVEPQAGPVAVAGEQG
jgi:selenocysteine-specific elongation factor